MIEEAAESLSQHAQQATTKSFWHRFRLFELHPLYYHLQVGTIASIFVSGLIGTILLAAPAKIEKANPVLAEKGKFISSYPVVEPQTVSQPTPTRRRKIGKSVPVLQFSEPEMTIPAQGIVQLSERFARYSGVKAPFSVTTNPSDGFYLMKMTDAITGELVAMCFIHRGTTFEMEVPLGTYKFKFASGEKWYGYTHLFGPPTVYSCIQDSLTFSISGNQSKGHSVELIPRVGGNLDTETLNPSEW
jgi:hypothetical protein